MYHSAKVNALHHQCKHRAMILLDNHNLHRLEIVTRSKDIFVSKRLTTYLASSIEFFRPIFKANFLGSDLFQIIVTDNTTADFLAD